jgi:hypothetical protein
MWYISLAQSSFHTQLLSSLVSSSEKVDNTIRATVQGCPLADAAFFLISLLSESLKLLFRLFNQAIGKT